MMHDEALVDFPYSLLSSGSSISSSSYWQLLASAETPAGKSQAGLVPLSRAIVIVHRRGGCENRLSERR